MPAGSLKKKILDDRFLTVDYNIASPSDLNKPVNGQPFTLAVINASTPRFETNLFDRRFGVSASAQAPVSIQLLGKASKVSDIEGIDPFPAPNGKSYADFQLELGVDLAGEGSIPTGGTGLELSVSAGGAGDGRYRHLVPVAFATPRLEAVERVVGGGRIPQLLDLKKAKLQSGEVHEISAGCHLDLGVRARLGREFDYSLIVEAFDQASGPFRAKVAFSLDATLGYSLDRRMTLMVGRVGLLQPGWVRVRLAAEKESRFAFGLIFQLLAEYDFGTGLLSLIEAFLDLVPVQRLKDAMGQLAEVADALENSDQTWLRLKQELTGEVAELIGEYVDDRGWLDWMEDSQKLKDALASSQRIVAAYRDLDDKLENLWDQILHAGRLADGERFGGLLEQVAGLDPAKPEALVDEKWRPALGLIETLTGSTVEELLFGSSQDAQQTLTKARDLAKRAASFLDVTPDNFLGKVNAFAQRAGVESVVEWLEANTRSPAAFRTATEGEVSSQIQRAVSTLLDKAWGVIGPDENDRKKLKELADSLRGLLDDADGWDGRLKAEALKLKGSLGFSLSLEMERLSHDAAILDLELDPQDPGCRQAFSRHLSRGRITKFLERLAEIDPADENRRLGPPLPYLLRDCVLTSKRVRSSSLAMFFSLLGVKTDRTQRLYESEVRYLQEDGQRSREGRYSGALIRTRVEEKMTASAAVWLELAGEGTGHNPAGPYDTSFAGWLRLTYTREDNFLTADEVHGLSAMLHDLGFVSPGGSFPINRPMHVGIEYRIPTSQDSVAKLLAGLDGPTGAVRWNQDLLNAAHRWFDERLVGVRDPALRGAYPNGERPLARHILPKFIQSGLFRDEWTQGILDFEKWARRKKMRIHDGGSDFEFSLIPDGTWKAPYLCLNSLVTKRGSGLKRFRALARSHRDLFSAPNHLASLEFAREFGTTFKRASPVYWPSPMSAVWLVLARLAQMNPTVFDGAKGVATWRWAEDGTPANPIVWRLEKGEGLANQSVRGRVFPVLR